MGLRRGASARSLTVALAVACCAVLLPLALSPLSPANAVAFDGEDADRWGCLGYNGLRQYNPAGAVAAGMMKVPSLPAHRVAVGSDVDWRLDPFRNPTWRMWLHSLNWTGDLIERALVQRDESARDLALGIARDYVLDNPVSSPQWPEAAFEATARRTNILTCLYRVSPQPWLRDAMIEHAGWLTRNWSGAWNKGLDEDLAVLGVACVTGTAELVDPTMARLTLTARQAFDAEGLSNEQSPAYTQYAVGRWRTGLAQMQRCGLAAPEGIDESLDRAEEFIAHATRPNGRLAPIGDTEDRLLGDGSGTGYAYPASGGAQGAPPARTTALYRGGWAFGRSTWTPFRGATWYSLRFGPRPLIHGHDDHGQVLFSAYGRDVLVEAGYDGYRPGRYRDYLVGRYAHNVLTVAGAAFQPRRGTDLAGATSRPGADSYTLYDVRYRGVAHQRSVLVSKQAPFVAVLDNATASTKRALTYTQWFHLPYTASARVVGRNAIARDGGQDILVVPVQLPTSRPGVQPVRTAVVKGQTRPTIAGWVSPGLYQRRPAPTVSVTTVGKGARLLTVVLPLPRGAKGGVGAPRRVGSSWLIQVNVAGRAVGLWVAANGRLSLERPRG